MGRLPHAAVAGALHPADVGGRRTDESASLLLQTSLSRVHQTTTALLQEWLNLPKQGVTRVACIDLKDCAPKLSGKCKVEFPIASLLVVLSSFE